MASLDIVAWVGWRPEVVSWEQVGVPRGSLFPGADRLNLFQRTQQRDLRKAKLKEQKEQNQNEALLEAVKVSSQSLSPSLSCGPFCNSYQACWEALLGCVPLGDVSVVLLLPCSRVTKAQCRTPPRSVASSTVRICRLRNILKACSEGSLTLLRVVQLPERGLAPALLDDALGSEK